MKEKLKLLLFKILYDEIGLIDIEQKIIDKGIQGNQVVSEPGYDPVSKYFFLLNDVNLDALSAEEKQYVERTVTEIEQINEQQKEQLYQFLSQNKNRLLLPQTSEKYLIWPGTDMDNSAPADAFVFSFQYIRYGDNYSEQLDADNEGFINDCINYVQGMLSETKNIKVAIIKCDETIIYKQNSVVL